MVPEDPFAIAASLSIPADDLRRALTVIELECDSHKSWRHVDYGRDNLDKVARLARELWAALVPDRESLRLTDEDKDIDIEALLGQLEAVEAAAHRAHRSPQGRAASTQGRLLPWMHFAAREVRALCKAAGRRDPASCFSPSGTVVEVTGAEARLLLAVLHKFEPAVTASAARTLARKVVHKNSGKKAPPL